MYVARIRKPHGCFAIVKIIVVGVDIRINAPDQTVLDTIRDAIEYIVPEKNSILDCQKVAI